MGNPLDILYDAVGWVVRQIYGVLSPVFGASSGWTWALTIIILVVAMRLVMVPLFIKQMHTTRAMTSLQPQMAALRKRYKNDKQTLNSETMKLYQEAGVNPLMGCLPVVAQLPLFFSLFSVLKAIAEWNKGDKPKYGLTTPMMQAAKHTQILGANIADKVLFTKAGVHVPLHAKAVIICAVLISMTTTYLTVRQSMKRGMMPTASPDNPMGNSQKYMAYIMPFFALTGLYWPFGLVLYWVTTNVWTLIQQWALFKRYPYTPPPPVDDAALAASPALGPKGISRSRPAPRPSLRSGPSGASPASDGSGKPAAGRSAKPAANGSARPSASGSAKPAAKGPARSGNGTARPSANGAANGSAKPAANGSARPSGNGAANGLAKPAANGAARPAANGVGKPPVRPARPVKPVNGSASPAVGGTAPAAASGMAGSVLRKFGRGRSEPEPQPEATEVKLVRQQPQRQSRSKRSGKG